MKRKGFIVRWDLKEARSKHASRWTRTDDEGTCRGWKSYFGYCQTPSLLKALDEWIRRRVRCTIWEQWKRGPVRFRKLRQRGVSITLIANTIRSCHGPWRLANSPALSIALPIAYFDSIGLPRLFDGPA